MQTVHKLTCYKSRHAHIFFLLYVAQNVIECLYTYAEATCMYSYALTSLIILIALQ